MKPSKSWAFLYHAILKNKTVYTILIAICIIGFWLFENFYTGKDNPYGAQDAEPSIIRNDFLPELIEDRMVRHKHYVLSYSEPHEQAEWVAYALKQEHLTHDDRRRPYFIEDPLVTSKSADWRNYKGSGYDRGHLCPAGDRRFSEFAYNETFYTSNIAPQRKDFNAGVWNRLEQQVRQWCKTYGTIYVITGGILEADLPGIGYEDVTVPERFFKVVVREENDKVFAMAFLLPHKESQEPLKNFVVSIDFLESQSDLDFFHQMGKNEQNHLEASSRLKEWEF